jgi:hypothetical protein
VGLAISTFIPCMSFSEALEEFETVAFSPGWTLMRAVDQAVSEPAGGVDKRCCWRHKGKGQASFVDSFHEFENFTYKVAVVPPLTKVTAWGKLQEYERRLVMYECAEALNDPRDPKYRVLLEDSVSAFLMPLKQRCSSSVGDRSS